MANSPGATSQKVMAHLRARDVDRLHELELYLRALDRRTVGFTPPGDFLRIALRALEFSPSLVGVLRQIQEDDGGRKRKMDIVGAEFLRTAIASGLQVQIWLCANFVEFFDTLDTRESGPRNYGSDESDGFIEGVIGYLLGDEVEFLSDPNVSDEAIAGQWARVLELPEAKGLDTMTLYVARKVKVS